MALTDKWLWPLFRYFVCLMTFHVYTSARILTQNHIIHKSVQSYTNIVTGVPCCMSFCDVYWYDMIKEPGVLRPSDRHMLHVDQINANHGDVIKWKHFPRNWPFVWGIHRSPVNSPHKGQWRGAFMFSLICARINGWVNNCEAGDLRRIRPHYDVTVMVSD